MNELQVVIGPETIRSYKRLAYESWWALAEFIDNSTQSYYSNQKALADTYELEGESFYVRMNYDRDSRTLRISDNAMGMDLVDLTRAVTIGAPPPDTTGRHEFGMGLKTAACWFGDIWKVTTTKLGIPEEYSITFDVNAVAEGHLAIEINALPCDSTSHYTIVEISNMHQKFQGRQLGRLKENLRSIYRFDTRTGHLDLRWGDELLSYDDNLEFMTASDGSEYRKDFSFEVAGKPVHGWGAILGSGGRPKAGFAVARRGRLIMGQPNAWRPSSIFGQEAGSNDRVNQRVVGEIHLDDFVVSHTKNAILWQDDELDVLEEKLREFFNDYRYIANNTNVRNGGPSPVDTDVALAEMAEILGNPEMVDLVTIEEVPSEEAVEAILEPLRASIQVREPNQVFVLGDLRVRLFLDAETSPNDPYFIGDYVSDESISVSINTKHPFWQGNITDSSDILVYALGCIYDALAEWKCMKKTGEVRPDTVKVIKDAYMRRPLNGTS